jgi:hypothetical protein
MRARMTNTPRERWAKGTAAAAAGTIALALLTASPASAATAPIGSVDVVTQTSDGIRVAGWAIDFDTADAVSVRVYVDGVASVTAPPMAST